MKETEIWTEEYRKHETLTGGIFYCRDSAGFNVSASNKLSCNLTSVLQNRQQKHTANR